MPIARLAGLLMMPALLAGCTRSARPVFPSSGDPGAAAAGAIHLEANKALVRRFYAALSAGDFAAADSMVAPHFMHHIVSDSGFRAIDWAAFKRGNAGARGAFPDWTLTPEILVAEGEYVSALVMGQGTHRGSLAGEPPTGRRTRLPVALVHRIHNGKIVADWEVVNTAPAMRALQTTRSPGSEAAVPE